MARRRRRTGSTSTTLSVLVVLVVVGLVLVRCAARRVAPPPRAVPAKEAGRPHSDVHQGRTAQARPEPAGPLASSLHVALGIPTDADPSDDVLLDEHEFVLSYNPKRIGPNWSAWRLDRAQLGHVRRRDDFRADDSLPLSVYHVTPHDYVHSGYDRGHLCPSADREATPDMNSLTFLMTNMVPQLHELNAGPWEKLEEHERVLAGRPDAAVYIVAGGVFDRDPPRIGHGIAVPRATWKIIVALRDGQTANDVTDSTELISVVMPNEPGVGSHAWTDYLASVDEIERETGYDFLARVPDAVESVIEARVTTPR